MGEVMTVRGPIEAADLGFTSMHEHLHCDASFYMDLYRDAVEPWDPARFPPPPDAPVTIENLAFLRHMGFVSSHDDWDLTDEELMAAETADYATAGGGAMLEVSAPGIRGDVRAMRRISELTGVHVVASTGLYAAASWPQRFHDMTVDQLTSYMIEEVEVGIDGTDVRAGHIKTACNVFDDAEQRALRAGAAAARATGVSMTVHHGLDVDEETSRAMVDVLLDAGADPERTILCHMQGFVGTSDIDELVHDPTAWMPRFDHLMALADRGFVLSIDTFGMLWDMEPLGHRGGDDARKLAAIAALCEAGHAERVVVGCDVFLKTMTRRYGSDGFARLLSYVAPMLERVGVAAADVRAITHGNPARLLEKVGSGS